MIVWHYTTRQCAMLIFESTVLKPADAYLTKGEKPILWFSKNQYWEKTANKAWVQGTQSRLLTMEEMREKGGGLFRFGIEQEKTINWPRLGAMAQMPSKIRKALEAQGIRQGGHFHDWCGLLEPVSIFECVGMVMNDNLEWAPM
jgi:hypothetical protein